MTAMHRAIGGGPALLGRPLEAPTRLFTRLAGVSLVRYRNRLRLRRALDLLAEMPHDLTGVALAAGFGDHSHFTNAFRREFGVVPSRFERDPQALVELSENLQA